MKNVLYINLAKPTILKNINVIYKIKSGIVFLLNANIIPLIEPIIYKQYNNHQFIFGKKIDI